MDERDLEKILELTRPVLRHVGRVRALKNKSPYYATEYLGAEQLEGHLAGYGDGMKARFLDAIEEFAGSWPTGNSNGKLSAALPAIAASTKTGLSPIAKTGLAVGAVGVGLLLLSALSASAQKR